MHDGLALAIQAMSIQLRSEERTPPNSSSFEEKFATISCLQIRDDLLSPDNRLAAILSPQG
jgi:hypothetical protein